MEFIYYLPKSLKSVGLSVAIQFIIALIIVIISSVIGYNVTIGAPWMFIIGGVVLAFVVYSLTENLFQKISGVPCKVTLVKNVLTIERTSDDETLISTGINKLNVFNTKNKSLRGGTVKQINIKYKELEFVLIDTMVKSSEKDMDAFNELYKLAKKH